MNFALINKVNVPDSVKTAFNTLIDKRKDVFANPNESLPYNTNVIATIRTIDNNPVYSKLYLYPVGVTEFVNKEMESLLADNIIRPSQSIWRLQFGFGREQTQRKGNASRPREIK